MSDLKHLIALRQSVSEKYQKAYERQQNSLKGSSERLIDVGACNELAHILMQIDFMLKNNP